MRDPHQIISAVMLGDPFVATLPNNEMIARYVRCGDVEGIDHNGHLSLFPLQGDELCAHIEALAEDILEAA